MSVITVRNGTVGRACATDSHSTRLKLGTSDTTRSGRLSCQCATSIRRRAVICQADGGLQQLELLRQADRPAVLQSLVVQLLRIEAGDAAKARLRIEHTGQIDEAHLPGPPLRQHHGLQRTRRGPVPSASVEVDEIDGLHGTSMLGRAHVMRMKAGTSGPAPCARGCPARCPASGRSPAA